MIFNCNLLFWVLLSVFGNLVFFLGWQWAAIQNVYITMLQMWDTFIAETAYFVLAVGNCNDRGTYAAFSQMMYQQYPYIGVNLNKSMHNPG